jgi:hypothetical protein
VREKELRFDRRWARIERDYLPVAHHSLLLAGLEAGIWLSSDDNFPACLRRPRIFQSA